MTADYNLEIATPLAPSEIAARLHAQCGGEVVQQRETIDVFSSEYYIVVSLIDGPGYAAVLGIAPRVRVNFYHRGHGYERTIAILKQFTLTWLRTTPDDLALLFEEDIVYLYRKGGQIAADNTTDFWKPLELESLDLPYVLMDIPPL
jgi:hypothetical protein